MWFSPLEQFQIISLVPLTVLNLDFTLTNSSLIFLIILFLWYELSNILGFLNGQSLIIPRKWQSVIEEVYQLVHSIVVEQAGRQALRYLPLILTIFLIIAFSNLIGMIPYTFTTTSHIAVTFGLSFTIFFGVTILGFTLHGLNFFSLLLPQGIPIGLAPLIILIELISYCMRAISLGIRLAANIGAGHCLFAILSSFSWQMLLAGGWLALASSLPVLIILAMTCLELLIGFLQAYVFVTLMSTYLNDSINLH